MRSQCNVKYSSIIPLKDMGESENIYLYFYVAGSTVDCMYS
jgi:hypothetical protein